MKFERIRLNGNLNGFRQQPASKNLLRDYFGCCPDSETLADSITANRTRDAGDGPV